MQKYDVIYSNELFLIALNRLFSKNLHYALTETNEHPVYSLDQFIKAQENYMLFLLDHILDVLNHDKSKKVLEVGPGTGQLMLTLLQKGYHIDGVMPSKVLIEECYNNFKEVNLQKPSTIHYSTFEKFESENKYDLIVFSESFQYIPYDSAFSLCKKLLNPNGHVIILDCFEGELFDEENPDVRGLSGGHSIKLVEESIKKNNFDVIKEQDLTKRTSYTMGFRQDCTRKFISIPWKQYFSISHAIFYKLVLFVIYPLARKKIQTFINKTLGGVNTHHLDKHYEKYKRYMLYVLKPR